jgi:PAS domain S-box-containing protein
MVTLKSIGDGVIVTDAEGCVELLNDVAETLTEWTTEMARGRPVAEVFTIRDCETMEEIVNFFESDSVESQASSLSRKAVLVSKSGTEYQIEDSLSRIQDEKGHLLGRVLVFRDVSGEVLMREQLLQTQKMESIGRLAGGVAHDFNNMLAVIMNSAELLQLDKALTPKSRNFVENILASAQRSADLTAKLLSFARKGKRLTRQIDLRALTESSVVLLKGTADKRIAIRLLDHEKNAYVQGDESQIQSVLMNLGINAVHAMPEGGELVFEIDECYLDKHYCQVSAFSIEPGRYVKVMVRDTGTGIARQDQNKIFEPFYSTKGQKGTGLGLSAALGAVIEHRGALTFYSEEGTGTVFHLYLPSAEEEKCQDEPELELVKGAGTILLVDDEEMIRQTGKLMLEDLGYDVLLADDGQEAVRIYEEMADQIDLVILDMIMPVMNGRQAFESIRRLNPFCAVMIASGFSREKDLAAMKAMGLAGVLLKPYSRYTLGLILQDFFAGLGAEKQLDKPTGQPSDKSSNKSTDKQVEE